MGTFQTWTRCLLLCCLFLISLSTYAHTNLDSLRAVIADEGYSQSDRMAAATTLARQLFSQDVPASQRYAREAMRLADEAGDREGYSMAMVFLAVGYSIRSEFDSAKALLSAAEAMALPIDAQPVLTQVYGNLGIIAFRKGHSREAIAYFECTAAYLRAAGDSLGLGKVYNNLGNAYKDLGEFDRAIEVFETSIRLKQADTSAQESSLAHTMMNLAMLYFHQQKYHKTFDALYEARQMFEHDGNKLGLITLTFNLGTIHESLGDPAQALGYYRYGMDLQEDMGMELGRGRMLSSVGRLEATLGDLPLGIVHHEEAICLQETIGDSLGLANSYFSLADLAYDHLHDLPTAERHARSAMRLAQQGGFWESKLHAHHVLARIAAEQQQWDTVLSHSQEILAIARAQELPLYQEKADRLLAQYHHVQGDHRQAYQYERAARNLSDSLNQEKALYEAIRQELGFFFQNRQARSELEQQEALNQQLVKLSSTRNTRNWLLIGLLVTLKVAIIIYVGYLHKQRHNQLLHSRQMELRQKNRDLLRLHQEKNQLIGVFTHDLRTPVTQIQALNQQLEQLHPSEDQTVQRFQSAITTAADRLSTTIDRILALNSLETKGVELSLAKVSVQPIIQEVAQDMQASMAHKSLTLHLDRPLPPCEVWSDARLLREVLENLVSNAIKFSPPGRNITLGAVCQEGEVKLYVKDEGPGIHPQDMPKLFGKFQKLRTRPTNGEPSTGLGLAIVQEYVKQLDGHVWCESTWGKGATFYLAFPCIMGQPQTQVLVAEGQVTNAYQA
jgi:signal transduction histidine kinase